MTSSSSAKSVVESIASSSRMDGTASLANRDFGRVLRTNPASPGLRGFSARIGGIARACGSGENHFPARSEIDSNSRSRWLSAERADFGDFPFSRQGSRQRSAKVGGTGERPATCRETSNVCISPEKERAGTCVVTASRAGADHVAIRDRVEDKAHGRVGDVRDGPRIRSHQGARETRSRAAGAELRDP